MLRQIDFTKLPITEIVDEIIFMATDSGASDIHFDPLGETYKVRFRIDGMLIDYTTIPQTIRKNLTARIKIIYTSSRNCLPSIFLNIFSLTKYANNTAGINKYT